MTKEITVAALQLALNNGSEAENIEAVSQQVANAAERGAQIILPPELFAGPYFCKTEDEALFAMARPAKESAPVLAMQKLARQLKVAIPASFFERDGQHYYNSIAIIDPDGEIMGIRHKTHAVVGIQFHPESIMTPVGKRILRNFLKLANI